MVRAAFQHASSLALLTPLLFAAAWEGPSLPLLERSGEMSARREGSLNVQPAGAVAGEQSNALHAFDSCSSEVGMRHDSFLSVEISAPSQEKTNSSVTDDQHKMEQWSYHMRPELAGRAGVASGIWRSWLSQPLRRNAAIIRLQQLCSRSLPRFVCSSGS